MRSLIYRQLNDKSFDDNWRARASWSRDSRYEDFNSTISHKIFSKLIRIISFPHQMKRADVIIPNKKARTATLPAGCI